MSNFRHLLIMRHGKSDWGEPGLDDHDRTLNSRGERDAPRMGRWVRSQHIEIGHVASSSAVRAQTTARLFCGGFECESEAVTVPALYLAAPETYLEYAQALPDAVSAAILIGHNPGVAELVHRVTGEGVDMPTSAIAVLRLDLSRWAELGQHSSALLEAYWNPKSLPADFD